MGDTHQPFFNVQNCNGALVERNDRFLVLKMVVSSLSSIYIICMIYIATAAEQQYNEFICEIIEDNISQGSTYTPTWREKPTGTQQ